MSNESSSNPSDCYSLQDVPEPVLVLHTIAASFILVGSVIGNCLVLVLVAKYKRLRRRSFIVGFSVIVADLAFDLTYHLPSVVSVAATRWPFSDLVCTVTAGTSLYCFITRWYTMAVLAIDRFCNVKFPFSYERHSKLIISVLITVAWLLPLFVASPNLVVADIVFRQNIGSCRFDCEEAGKACNGYTALVWTSAFTIGAGVPTLLYVWLYRKARRLRASSTVVLGQVSVQVASGAIVSQPMGALERNTRELQAVITFAIVFITFVLTGLPAYSILIARLVNVERWCNIPIYVHFVANLIFMSSTMLDPLVIMRERDFRWCLKDALCSCKGPWRRQYAPSTAVPIACNGSVYYSSSDANGHLKSGKDMNDSRAATTTGDTLL